MGMMEQYLGISTMYGVDALEVLLDLIEENGRANLAECAWKWARKNRYDLGELGLLGAGGIELGPHKGERIAYPFCKGWAVVRLWGTRNKWAVVCRESGKSAGGQWETMKAAITDSMEMAAFSCGEKELVRRGEGAHYRLCPEFMTIMLSILERTRVMTSSAVSERYFDHSEKTRRVRELYLRANKTTRMEGP